LEMGQILLRVGFRWHFGSAYTTVVHK
jgi:hypothetical protein